jgi:phage shock protein A
MNVLNRFFRLARADAHGVLDALEDRTLVIRQCLREAELELERKRARRAELESCVETGERERERLAARERELDGDVALAIERGESELARFSVRRLLGTRRQREGVELRLREARSELDALASALAAQQSELEELRQQAEAELAREQMRRAACRNAPDASFAAATSGAGVCDEEVELELLRRQSARVADEARS